MTKEDSDQKAQNEAAPAPPKDPAPAPEAAPPNAKPPKAEAAPSDAVGGEGSPPASGAPESAGDDRAPRRWDQRKRRVAKSGETSKRPTFDSTAGPEGGERPRRTSPRGASRSGPNKRPGGRGDRRPAKPAEVPEEWQRRHAAKIPPEGGKRAAPAPAPKPVEPPKKEKETLDVVFLGLPQARSKDQRPKAVKPAKTAKEMLAEKARKKGGGSAKKQKAQANAGAMNEAWLNATAETARASLEQAAEAGPNLIDAWAKRSNHEPLLALAHDEEIGSANRKAMRRALNVLKARGVDVPEPKRRANLLEDASGEQIAASFMPPDGSGTFSITVTSRNATGRCHVAEVIAREPVGILRAAAGWLSRTQLREGQQRAKEQTGLTSVDVPVDWARARIAEAKALNSTSKQLLPLSYDGCKELVEPAPEATPNHPAADLEPADSDAAWAEARQSGALHAEPEFRSWVPDRGALDEMLMKVGNALGADGASDPEKVDTALQAEIKAATDRFFTPEARTIIAKRMRDAAISVRARDEARARKVVACARAVEEAGLITSPPQEIEFLVGFFQKGVALMARQGGGQLRVPRAPGAQASP